MGRRSRKPSRLQLARAEGRPLDESVAFNIHCMAHAAEAMAAGMDMLEKFPEKSPWVLDTDGGDMIQYEAKA